MPKPDFNSDGLTCTKSSSESLTEEDFRDFAEAIRVRSVISSLVVAACMAEDV